MNETKLRQQILEVLMNDSTLYCCYCFEQKRGIGCCSENHFITYSEMYEDDQKNILDEMVAEEMEKGDEWKMFGSNGTWTIVNPYGKELANIYDEDAATLMASAPELLDVLKTMVETFCPKQEWKQTEIYQLANSLISKIEGVK